MALPKINGGEPALGNVNPISDVRTIIEAPGLRAATPDEARARPTPKGVDRVKF